MHRPASGQAASSERGLLQVLGVGFGIAVLVGNTIGMGILRTPGEVARHVPSVPLFLAVWVVAGVYALLGALALSELGAMHPRSGGVYPLVRRSLGPTLGFVAGWTDWCINTGSTAAIAMVLAEYLAPLVPATVGHPHWVAATAVVGIAGVQVLGTRFGDAVQQATSLLKGIALLGLAGVAMYLSPETATVASLAATPVRAVHLPEGAALVTAFTLALQSAIYTYDGWTGPLYFGEEVQDPGRDIPRAMIGGLLVVLAIYLAMNLAFLRHVPIGEMSGDPFVAATVARRLFHGGGDTVLRVVMIVSMLVSVNALTSIYSRIPHAMSSDGLLPPALRKVNSRGTPVPSLCLSVLMTLAFILSNTFDSALALLAFFMIFNYGLAFVGVFRLRWQEPDAPRPFRVPGYPFVPALALLGSAAFLAATIWGDPARSAAAIALVAVSVPLARLAQRRTTLTLNA